MIQAVIFDMDGLMIETEHLQSVSYEQVLNGYGINPEFNEDGVIQIVGVSAKDNMIRLKEKYSISEHVEHLLVEKHKRYRDLLLNNIHPKKGLLALLNGLKNNFKLGVASSSSAEDINLVLHGLGVRNFFDVIVSAEHVEKGKPFPDIFLKAANELNIGPEACLVLEDAESGVLAAYEAKIKVIAIPNQYTRSHNFDKADRVVSSLEEVGMDVLINF